jgi:dTDP-4-amino-4,6-dideoxygalactose transaminase
VRESHSTYDRIMDTIGIIQENTAKELWKQRSEIWTTLDKKLEDIKQQLKAESDKKKENSYDFKEKEKELNEHLETMT